jgi:hypothetical protein
VRLEELGRLKNPGIEPATFRLAALCLNQLRYRILSSASELTRLYCVPLLKEKL